MKLDETSKALSKEDFLHLYFDSNIEVGYQSGNCLVCNLR
jgi:hypothetical protein